MRTLPHSRKPAAAPEPVNDRPWEQPDEWTAKEKFWAVMGALKATLLIAGAYLVGLAVLLAVLFWLCLYCLSKGMNDPFMYFRF